MPPIKVYAGSAINASKASDASPQTDSPQRQQDPPPATTTAGAAGHGYPPAQPAAVPSIPQQTAAPSSNFQPTPTQPLSENGPPPPQPGAVPVPPPPRAGGAAQTPQTTAMPPQMSWPAPDTAPSHATSGTYPAQPGFSPPAGGYQQDVHAAGYAAGGDRGGSGGGYDGDDGSVWDTAKKWAASAGESLAAAEQEVWKRINKD